MKYINLVFLSGNYFKDVDYIYYVLIWHGAQYETPDLHSSFALELDYTRNLNPFCISLASFKVVLSNLAAFSTWSPLASNALSPSSSLRLAALRISRNQKLS